MDFGTLIQQAWDVVPWWWEDLYRDGITWTLRWFVQGTGLTVNGMLQLAEPIGRWDRIFLWWK